MSAGNGALSTTKKAVSDALPWRGSNVIGLVFATSFDVYDFLKHDIGEQNIAEFAGSISSNST